MNGGGVTPSPTPYVDLGLPSGLLWGRYNIGSNSPEDGGYYFSWGNVEAHAKGSGYDFSEPVYGETPGAALSGNIPLSQDAARVILGGDWRMPTGAEFQELLDNCTYEWTMFRGRRGLLFTSNENGNTLFFPAAGFYNGQRFDYDNSRGEVWSSTWEDASRAIRLRIMNSDEEMLATSPRYVGFNIRAVMEST